MPLWRDLLEQRINTLHHDPVNKVVDLASAVRTHVKPGMKINAVALQSRPSAVLYEICRQFAGTNLQFEYIASSIGNTQLALLHLGLLKKAIVSFAGESYPTPGPSPVVHRALESGAFELENWTMLTITQRLLGGAMGVPYFPTRSLSGSDIGEALKPGNLFIETEDPDRPGESAGLLRSYRPDVSFVHAWAADEAGNAICFPPFGENIYGALAAKNGVIVTADHIVPTEFIREHSNLVRIPAAVTLSVSHVPYGCHPSGNFALGVEGFQPFGNDYQFMIDCRKASKNADTFQAWIDEWILGVPDHAAYVAKLGEERVKHLHFVAEPLSWREELDAFTDNLESDRPASPIEVMIVQAARTVATRLRDEEYKTILSGVGQATLMAWLAAHALRDEGREVTMMAETGIYGHDPRPSDPFVFNYRNLPTTTVLTDIFETLGLHTGGASNRCLGTFGAGQIDRHGNVNSTRSADGSFIVGSGGANDIATASCETVVVAQQRPGTLVEKVDYITSPGTRISTLVTTMGRYEKRGGDSFILTGVIVEPGQSREEAIREAKERCGWDLDVADDVETLAPVTQDELTLLRLFDPERFFLGKAVEVPAPAK